MKVLFVYSKSLGNLKAKDKKEMFCSTAAVLERKGFGKITQKITSLKKTAEGMKRVFADLSEDDRVNLKLDESLVVTVSKK
jgi:predicted DNA binding CopG/RHH family protein